MHGPLRPQSLWGGAFVAWPRGPFWTLLPCPLTLPAFPPSLFLSTLVTYLLPFVSELGFALEARGFSCLPSGEPRSPDPAHTHTHTAPCDPNLPAALPSLLSPWIAGSLPGAQVLSQ